MPALPAKVCPLVTRPHPAGPQVLGFRHPVAGCQFVKGGIKPGEAPAEAARRELWEESGLRLPAPPRFLAVAHLGAPPLPWHLFHLPADGLPERWSHQTADDHGHRFDFFWHPLSRVPGADWHPVYAEVWRIARPLIG